MAKKQRQNPAIKAAASSQAPAIKNEPAKKSYSLTAKLAILLAVISFLVYVNTLQNGYVLDDNSAITENKIVTKGITAIPEIFTTPYHMGNSTHPDPLYRPLSLVMFAIEYQMFGEAPGEGHFINVLLFAGCVVLLFVFLNLLFNEQKTELAFIAALLFAVHPIHTEVVANIKSRDELLCFFFAFLCLYLFIKYTATGKIKLLLAGTCFLFLSLLSKETSITFLAVIPLVFFFYKNENKQRSTYLTIAAITAAAVFLAIRAYVFSTHATANTYEMMINALAHAPSASSRLATEIAIMGKYVQLLFIPYPLLCSYAYNSIPFSTFSNAAVIVSLLCYLALIFIGCYRFIKNRKDPFAFGILFFLITIFLFSNIPFLLGVEMAERFLFFASAGFCIVIAFLTGQVLAKYDIGGAALLTSSKTWAIAGTVCVVFAALTIYRNTEWSDPYTLFTTDARRSPNDARIYAYLGNYLTTGAYDKEPDLSVKKQLLAEGIEAQRKAVAIYPDYTEIQINIGTSFMLLHELDSVVAHEKLAIAQKTKNLVAYNNLAAVYFERNNYPEALTVCKQLITIDPDKAENYYNVGACYFSLKQYDSAINYFKEVTEKGLTNGPLLESIARSYYAQGAMDSARRYYYLSKQAPAGPIAK